MWIDYVFKGLAVLLGYSLNSQKNATDRKRAIEANADNRADAKFSAE